MATSKPLLYFQQGSDTQKTPQIFYEALDKIYRFDFDPCPLERPSWDGLKIDWGKMNWVNPPFSESCKWITKGVVEMREKGSSSLFLIPFRPHSRYWFTHIFPNCTRLTVLKRKLCFGEHKTPLPVPLCLVEFKAGSPPCFDEKRIKKIEDVDAVELGNHE